MSGPVCLSRRPFCSTFSTPRYVARQSGKANANDKTYGRTYLELDELYERRIPAWRFKHTLTAADKARI
jgi:hypothetical protein